MNWYRWLLAAAYVVLIVWGVCFRVRELRKRAHGIGSQDATKGSK